VKDSALEGSHDWGPLAEAASENTVRPRVGGDTGSCIALTEPKKPFNILGEAGGRSWLGGGVGREESVI